METETISSRNIVDLLFRERFGTGVCGKESPTFQADGQQAFLVDETERHSKLKAEPEDFVVGWDC